MIAKPLLPQVFWFRMAAPCTRIEEIPRPADSARLLDLPETCLLPDWGQLDGSASWTKVRVAWNPHGLGITVVADGIAGTSKWPLIGPRASPWSSSGSTLATRAP